MHSFRFQLAIYDRTFSHLIPVEEYLRADDELRWRPSLDDCGFFLECQGREWLADTYNMGNLALVVRQMEEAAARLARGDEAIIRSGVLDQDEVPYMLFEQPFGGLIMLSLFFIEDSSMRHSFPIEGFSGSGQDLYAYVREHRDELLAQPAGPRAKMFKSLPCPAAELVHGMEREAKLGRQLFDVLGVAMREGLS
jgi:hypothetical protein